MKLRSLIAFLFVLVTTLMLAAGPRDLSPAAARADAERDTRSGHMRIYRAGGEASTEVGVAAAERHLIRGIPRDDSISLGCIDPQPHEHIAYAEAYNKAVIRYLKQKPRNT